MNPKGYAQLVNIMPKSPPPGSHNGNNQFRHRKETSWIPKLSNKTWITKQNW